MTEDLEPLPLSALNHLTYCERRCALIHIEGVFEENAFTLQGGFLHETTRIFTAWCQAAASPQMARVGSLAETRFSCR